MSMNTIDSLLKVVATSMTLSKTKNKELKKQWLQLEMMTQLVEKELFKMNLDTIEGVLQDLDNTKARLNMLEQYFGAFKNRLESHIDINEKNMKAVKKRLGLKSHD